MACSDLLWCCVIHDETLLYHEPCCETITCDISVLTADLVDCQIAAILLALASINFKIFEGESLQNCAPCLLRHANMLLNSAFQSDKQFQSQQPVLVIVAYKSEPFCILHLRFRCTGQTMLRLLASFPVLQITLIRS